MLSSRQIYLFYFISHFICSIVIMLHTIWCPLLPFYFSAYMTSELLKTLYSAGLPDWSSSRSWSGSDQLLGSLMNVALSASLKDPELLPRSLESSSHSISSVVAFLSQLSSVPLMIVISIFPPKVLKPATTQLFHLWLNGLFFGFVSYVPIPLALLPRC